MKKAFITALCLGIAIVSCKKDNGDVPTTTPTNNTNTHNTRRFTDSSLAVNSSFITAAVANAMISSYLYSINSTANDTDVRSFSINADSLRLYLNNSAVKNVKVMLAHTTDYINAGYQNQYAGYQSGALTLVIACYDASGNYIYYNGCVLDHVAPCPYSCPGGNAGSDLLE